jgi:hypothetical protein
LTISTALEGTDKEASLPKIRDPDVEALLGDGRREGTPKVGVRDAIRSG